MTAYRVLERIPAGVRVLRLSTLTTDAALVECEHDPAFNVHRPSFGGLICGFCKGDPHGPRVKSIVRVVPAADPGEPAGQETLF